MKSPMINPVLRALSPPRVTTWLALAVAVASVLASACSSDAHMPTATAAVTSVTVTPNAVLSINHTQQFTAVGRDASGRVVAVSPAWAVVASGGSIDKAGVFTAGAVAGNFTNTIQATSNGVSGYATVVLAEVAPSPSPVYFGAAASQAILAGSTVTCVNLGVINGEVSVSPGTAITGFPPCVMTGAQHTGDAYAQAAQGALATAFNQIAAMPCGATLSVDLGGLSLQPGVYCALTSLGLTGEMFLDAQSDSNAIFVIKAGSTLTTAAAQVTLLNGAQAKNVYWLVGSSATLGVGSAMKGSILAYASISLVDNATLVGRALAQNGAVTLGTNNTITLVLPPAFGPLATIVVTPISSILVGNTTQQFTAVGKDANGNVLAISPVWSVVANGGSIGSTGLFTAGTVAGTFTNTVQATSGAISGSASVTVTIAAPPLATITITPNPTTMAGNATQQFTAVGTDANGNVLAISPVWAVVANGGSIGSSGLFTAGAVAGTFINTVQATSGAVSGFASVTVTPIAPPPPLVDLGAAATHGILANSTVTCVNLGVVNAEVSVWPGIAITGFPPCVITGAQHTGDPYAQAAQSALAAAYLQLAAMPCGTAVTTDLGGQTLQPGVYCASAAVGLTGEMFLDAQGDPNAIFVIKAGSTLTTATAQVTLLNGAQAKNIYWMVGSSATLGVGSAMKGNILAYASITLVDNATLLGRALAQNGAVTLGTSNTITLP